MADAQDLQAVDLFCGAGGLTAGLERAGFHTVAAIDQDRDCIATLEATRAARIPSAPGRTHLDGTRVLQADVADLCGSDLRPPHAPTDWQPALLAGGPPCQPFSSAGRQRGVEDPRGRLFLHFVRLAAELQPPFVLFENVRGLLTAKTPDGRPGGVLELVQRSFEEVGYACRFALVNAADHGAAQRRVRLFMLAAHGRRLPEFPAPTHAREPDDTLLDVRKPWTTLAEFLADRPEPDPRDVVRPPPSRRDALAALRPGQGLRSGGIVEANRPGGHWGYRQDCFLADPRMPARTVRAASTPDWIRLPDDSLRRLTWRECAALQGFPDGWDFQGTAASRFRQIGNAVQGDVAFALGRSLAAAAADTRPRRPRSAPWSDDLLRRVRYTAMEQRVNGTVRAEHRRRGSGSV